MNVVIWWKKYIYSLHIWVSVCSQGERSIWIGRHDCALLLMCRCRRVSNDKPLPLGSGVTLRRSQNSGIVIVISYLPSELSSELLDVLWWRIVLLFSIESFRWWWWWWWRLWCGWCGSLSWWSSRQNSPSSRRANSSPGTNCFSQATQRKHSKWKILFLARITKSFLPKERKHLSHFVPNSLKWYVHNLAHPRINVLEKKCGRL